MSRNKDNNYRSKSSRTNVNRDVHTSPHTISNDPSWYMSDLMRNNVANFAYAYPNGARYNLGLNTVHQTQEVVPGIMVLNTMAAFGAEGTSNNSLNVAANNIYSYVRHMNSGASNYDAPDLMIYILSMASCYSLHAWMRRLYGVLRSYDANNWYKPEGLVRAMGVNFNEFREHIVDFRAYINMYASKLATLKIPKDLGLMDRMDWMYERVYKDEESDKAQLLFFNPVGFYQYHEDYTDPEHILGDLTWREFNPNNSWTYQDFIDFADDLLNVNRDSEDHNIMSGDIMKAYQGNVKEAYQISEDYVIEPEYDETYLVQIHNATAVGQSVINYGVTQNRTTGKLINEIEIDEITDNELDVLCGKRFVNQHRLDVDSSLSLEATRLISIPEADGKLTNVGSDLVTTIEIWHKDGDTWYSEDMRYVTDVTGSSSLSSALEYWLQNAQLLSMFRYHPPVNLVITSKRLVTFYDLYNYTIVDKQIMDRLNEVAILGLLGIK